jgi:hypothetical protein
MAQTECEFSPGLDAQAGGKLFQGRSPSICNLLYNNKSGIAGHATISPADIGGGPEAQAERVTEPTITAQHLLTDADGGLRGADDNSATGGEQGSHPGFRRGYGSRMR